MVALVFLVLGLAPQSAISQELKPYSEACAASLKKPALVSVIEEGPLKITNDHWVLWKGQKIFRTHYHLLKKKKKIQRDEILGRLLVALIDRKNRLVDSLELYEDVWPGGREPELRKRRSLVAAAATDLKRRFLSYDPDFHEIRAIRSEGFAWDTGERPDKIVRGPLELSPSMMDGAYKGMRLPLTAAQFRILYELAREPGRRLSSTDIYKSFAGAQADQRMQKDSYLITIGASVEITKLRGVFEAVDPDFNSIHGGLGRGSWWWKEN